MCSSATGGVASGFGLSTSKPHWPRAVPPTTLELEPESPNCVAGLLPAQIRFPSTRLASTSPASGSAIVLLRSTRLPPTWLRRDPIQQVFTPVIQILPLTELFSLSKYGGIRLLFM